MITTFLGTLLRDRYRVDLPIGSGRMAEVYRGHDIVLERPVAIKLLTGGDEPTRARFMQEARAMAQLNHHNIIAIYDFGEFQQFSYIVMEYVDGVSLAQFEAQHAPFSQLHSIFLQVLSALDLAHRKNIIHRDLKPENILIDPECTVKVADFGLSRRLSDIASASHPGQVVGTISYLSPEIFLGKANDGRGDLYAIGVMLYEAFTGRLPFPHAPQDVVAMIYAHVHDIPVPPRAYEPSLPQPLEALILRLLEKDPERRYATAAEVSAELSALRLGADTRGENPDPVAKAAPPVIEPGIRSVVDRIISPQRSTKMAFGKILGAMLAARRKSFAEAVDLYEEALHELKALKSEGEYIKGAIGMGESTVSWLRRDFESIDTRRCQACLEHLEEACLLARLRGQTRELHALQRLLGEVETFI